MHGVSSTVMHTKLDSQFQSAWARFRLSFITMLSLSGMGVGGGEMPPTEGTT